MAKLLALYALFVLALANAALAITANPEATTTHVMVRMELDNTVKQVNSSLPTLKNNIAKELCGVPPSDVTILKVMDDSKKIMGVGDTQTLVYAACKAPVNKLEAVLDDCQDWWNQHQVKDETQDSTSWFTGGEVKVDDIECRYVDKGNFTFFSKSDATKAGTPLPAAAAADNITSAVDAAQSAVQNAVAQATKSSGAAGHVTAAFAAIAMALAGLVVVL